ncbi:MAG TPA: MFS transporter [Propionicimonas sp.]|nr:MFS transporter [Propionicimonas sp.]
METKQRNTVLAVLFVGVLMGALDIAIVGPALPAIQAQFDLDTRAASWIFSAYVLANLVGTPLMAKLSDYFGRRAIYITDVALFALGSVVVIASASVGGFALLLAGRAIQGLGAGGIFPVASAVIGDTFPADRRGRALGLIGAVFGIAFVIGPILGGVLLLAGWQWLFVINLPIAVVVIVLAWRVLPSDRLPDPGRFDSLGMVLLGGALLTLALGLVSIDTTAFWASLASPLVWGSLLISVLCWVALVAVERRAANPVFPVALFARRQLRVGYLLTAGAGLGEASLVFLPLLAVAALAVEPSTASFLLMPVVLAMSVGSPLAGRLLDRFGSRSVILAGVAVLTAGMLLLGQTGSVLGWYIAAGVLIGLGLSALLGAPIRYVTLNETTATERSAGQGMVNIFTSTGQLLGAAAVGAIAASGTVAAYLQAYTLIGVLGVVLFVIALMLKRRAQENLPVAAPAVVDDHA